MKQEKDNQETQKRKRIIVMLLLLLLFLFFMIIIVIFLMDDLNPNTGTPNGLYEEKNIISNNEKNHGNTPKPNQNNNNTNNNTDTTPKEEENKETEVKEEETPAPTPKPTPIPTPNPKPIPSVPPIEHVDREAPVCTLTTATVSPTNTTSIIYTATINEEFNGEITPDHIAVAFGEVKDIYRSGRTFTFKVESNQSGLQSVYIRANAITDKANNKNAKSNTVDTVIDIISPTISFSNTQEILAMDPSQASIHISTLVSANDLGGSGLDTLQYAWNNSETVTPDTWTSFSNGDAITQDCPVGNSYLWVKLQDRAGNSSILLKKYTIAYAVAESNGILYLTLQDAIDAAPVDQPTIITMLANVTENTTNTKDVSIQGNFTITGTMTNKNKLDINGVRVLAKGSQDAIHNYKDFSLTSGNIQSESKSAVLNNSTGTVTLINGTLTSENYVALYNRGTAEILNADILSETNTAIRNLGTITAKPGSSIRTGLTATGSTIYNDPTGKISLQGSSVVSPIRNAISNYGEIKATLHTTIENSGVGFTCINNNGTLELTDSTVKANSASTITNRGNTTISGNSSLQNYGNYRNISNYKTLSIEGGTIYTDISSAVINEAGSDFTFTGGTLTNGVNNTSTRIWNKGGTVTVGGNVSISNNSKSNPPVRNESGIFTLQDTASITTTHNLQPALLNNGTFIMNGGTLTSNYYALQNASIATITNGTITSPNGIAILTALKSTTTITGGNISAFKSNAIKSMGSTYIKGGTITAQGATSTMTTATLLTTNAGMFDITGGTISSEKGYALYLNASPAPRSYIKDNAYLTNNSATIPTVMNAATVNYTDKVGLIMTGGSVINQNSNGYAVANASTTMKVTLSGGVTLPRNNIKGDINWD